MRFPTMALPDDVTKDGVDWSGEDTQMQTFHLAVPQPMLPPTAEEIRAREYTAQQFSKPLSKKRLRELKAMGKQPERKTPEDPIIVAKRREIAQLERELGG